MLFIRYLENTDRMVAKFNGHEKHIANDLMQLLVHDEIVAKLISHRLISSSFEMSSLSRIENLTEHILGVSLETDWFSQSTCDDLTEKGIFHAIIQENWTSLHIKQVAQHFNQSWQVKL